jgi:hypothetical protein
MRSARLKPQLISNEREVPETEWLDLSCEWLRSPDRPTAVITYEADRQRGRQGGRPKVLSAEKRRMAQALRDDPTQSIQSICKTRENG